MLQIQHVECSIILILNECNILAVMSTVVSIIHVRGLATLLKPLIHLLNKTYLINCIIISWN